MTRVSRQVYPPLPGDTAEIGIANELRELANMASDNSARSLEQVMKDWPDRSGIGHSTISDVLNGRNAANKLRNVELVARALSQSVAGWDAHKRAEEVRRVKERYETAFQPPHSWERNITRHCSNVAFDWASALPHGPRNAHEVIATVAARDGVTGVLRTEVLGRDLPWAIEYRVMQAAPARRVGNGRLPNAGWNSNSDDGPTWHGMWGPIGFGKPAQRFLAVHLDALGAVSAYLRVGASTDIEVGKLAQAAVDAAFQILCLTGWRGKFGVLVRSVSPAAQPQKHREFTASLPSRDGKSFIGGSATWKLHANTTVTVAETVRIDDYRQLAARLTPHVMGTVGEPEDYSPGDLE